MSIVRSSVTVLIFEWKLTISESITYKSIKTSTHFVVSLINPKGETEPRVRFNRS